MQTARARRAILRRALLVAGIILGIVCAFWQRAVLYRIRAVDFADRQQREYAWTGRRTMPLAQYIAQKTEGHLLYRDGEAWLDFYDMVAGGGGYQFFLPRHAPLDDLVDHLKGPFTYVALNHGVRTTYLDVVAARPDGSPAAPTHLRYPLRRFALGVFLVGLAGYMLIPWPRRNRDTVGYARSIGALVPDLGVGTLFIGVFFTLPWLIVPGEAGTSHPLVLDGGWIILTLAMWGLCLFGLAILGVAAWYEARAIHVGETDLTIESILGTERIAFTDIERVTCGVREPPKALVTAGYLMSLINWRAAGPTLLVASRSDPLVCIVTRDGKQRNLSLTGLYNLERLIAAMKKADIPVDPELESPDN